MYVKQKTLGNNVITYGCERLRGTGPDVSGCKTKVKVNGELIVLCYLHVLACTLNRIMLLIRSVKKYRRFLSSLKQKAEQTEATPQKILGQEIQNLSLQEAIVQMAPIKAPRRCHEIDYHPN